MPCLRLAPNQISNFPLRQFFMIILTMLIKTIYICIFHYQFPAVVPHTSLFIWTLPDRHAVISRDL